jgi:hypothetical protein
VHFVIERELPARRRLVVQRSAAPFARGVLSLVAALGTACASDPDPTAESLQPVRVRIGAIGPAAIDTASRADASLRERIEQLVDLFWQRGCGGGDLSRPRMQDTLYPDVVCRLPGRMADTVVVAAYVDPRSERGEDSTGLALLPYLYAALSVERREHSFAFVGLARRSRVGLREDTKRLEESRRDQVRAIVDLHRLREGSSSILFDSSDPRLHRDLSAVGLASGQPGESLRLIALPGAKGWFPQRGRIPMIRMASPHPAQAVAETAASGAGVAGDRETFRSAARTLAIFLAYLDETLRLPGEPPALKPGGP